MRFGIGNKSLIVFIILLAFSVTACSQERKEKTMTVEEQTEKARNLRIKGDFEGALKEQLKAVDLDPKNDDSLMLLGGIYIELGRYDNASEILQKSIQINPNNILAYHSLSIALGELGKDREALAAIIKAVELDPDNYEFLNFLGANYEQNGDKKNARDSYQKTLQIKPDYVTGDV